MKSSSRGSFPSSTKAPGGFDLSKLSFSKLRSLHGPERMLLSVAALVLLTGVFFLQRSMFGGSSSAQPIQIAKSADPLDEAASVGHILLDQTHQEDQTVTSTRKNFESLGSVDIPVSSLITTATVLAEGYVDPAELDTWWTRMGHIANIPDQFKYVRGLMKKYRQIRHVCEIGFGAGHSALAFLTARDDITLTVFDLGELPYSHASTKMMRSLFEKRFRAVFGDSAETVEEFGDHFKRSCDFFSVDGDHGPKVHHDLHTAIRATRLGGYIFVDDVSSAYPDVKEAWEAITQGEKLVEQIECRSFGSVGNVERRSCLGVVKV